MLKTKRAQYVMPIKNPYEIYNSITSPKKLKQLTRVNIVQHYVPLSHEGGICIPNSDVGFPYILRQLRLEKSLNFLSQVERLDILKVTSRIRSGPTLRHNDHKYLISRVSAILECDNNTKPNYKRSKRSEESKRQKVMYDHIRKHIAINVKDICNSNTFKDSITKVLELFKSCLNYKTIAHTNNNAKFSRKIRIVMASLVIKACLKNRMRTIIPFLFDELSKYSNEQLGITSASDYNPILRSCLVTEEYVCGSKIFFNSKIVLKFIEDRNCEYNDDTLNATIFTRLREHEILNLPWVLQKYLEEGKNIYPSSINRCLLSVIRSKTLPMNTKFELIKNIVFLVFKMPFHVENIYVDDSLPEPIYKIPNIPITFDGNRNRKTLLVNRDTFKVLGRGTNNTELALLLIERAEYYGFIKYPDVQVELLRLLLRTNVARRRMLHMDFIKRLYLSDCPLTPILASELIQHMRTDYLLPGLINYLEKNNIVQHKSSLIPLKSSLIPLKSSLIPLKSSLIPLNSNSMPLKSCIYNMCMNFPSSLTTMKWWAEIFQVFGLPMPRSRIISVIKMMSRFEEFYMVYVLYLQFLNFIKTPISTEDYPFTQYNTSHQNFQLSALSKTLIIDNTNLILREFPAYLFGPNLSARAIKDIKRRFLFEITLGHSLDSAWTQHAAKAFKDDNRAFRYILRGAAKHYTYSNILPAVFKFIINTRINLDLDYMKHILMILRSKEHPRLKWCPSVELCITEGLIALDNLVKSISSASTVSDSCEQLERFQNKTSS